MLKGILSLCAGLTCVQASGGACAATVSADPAALAVVREYEMIFPRDFGAHDGFRTEWWYVTGWLRTKQGDALGFQVTFFRSRTDSELTGANPSAFTPTQILIAHGALSDPRYKRLRQEQRIARTGFGLAAASQLDTNIQIGNWGLQRAANRYQASIEGEQFSIHLSMRPTQPPLLNGERGFSQKGPLPGSASHYYSLPHLQVEGTVDRGGVREAVSGEAWLDHEWSSQYLDPIASGWDWTGINFDDGSALMAFRIRGKDGTIRWAGATWRDADGSSGAFEPGQIEFTPIRQWRSERTSIRYPVAWRIRIADHEFELRPLLDDQENDTRATTGAIYWEGAVTASRAGHDIGRGYLELTGYGEALRLP